MSKSGLTYDTASGLYTYVWKTDKTWKGTCRELNLKLADGTNHPVQFRFTQERVDWKAGVMLPAIRTTREDG